MFGISGFELGLVALVALLVLGPERLPKAARFAGLWVRRARAQWFSVKAELERELAADELKRSLADTAAPLQQALKEADAGLKAGAAQVEAEGRALADAVRLRGAAEVGAGLAATGSALAQAAGDADAKADAAPAAPAIAADAAPPAEAEPAPSHEEIVRRKIAAAMAAAPPADDPAAALAEAEREVIRLRKIADAAKADLDAALAQRPAPPGDAR
jgi:sec-independent protein translocase protein TatB